MPDEPLLSIENLQVRFRTAAGPVEAVRGVSLDVSPGECLAIVGESGSGKSQTLLATLGLLPSNAAVFGSARCEGQELIGGTEERLRAFRGRKIGMIFQDPLSALAGHLRIGEQLATPIQVHRGLSRADAMREAEQWLDRVRITEPRRRLRQYPHELSGGMRQRVMIAGALACRPRLLFADEPTTALDVTVQAEVLDLLDDVVMESGTALVLVTHEMGVVARLAHRVAVMSNGKFVETGPVSEVLQRPQHVHTRKLLAAVPRMDDPVARPDGASVEKAPVLDAREIRVDFDMGRGIFAPKLPFRAVDGVSLSVRSGETLGIVGESGSGKSTLVRAALHLLPDHAPTVFLLGEDLAERSRNSVDWRRDAQIIFQDPLGSLDPSMTVAESLGEPLGVHRPDLREPGRRQAVSSALERVGLSWDFAARYPQELSGGQAQRVGIARALMTDPKVLVCDEAVSALDVSIRSEILKLLSELQEALGLAIIFISHDMAVVRQIADRVLVLYRGRAVEQAPARSLFEQPRHPYTKRLLQSVLPAEPQLRHERPRSRPEADLPPHIGPLVEVAPDHWVADVRAG